ncbi:MAG: glucosamine-6-phosphate deaminase [Candidatus Rifleibacteriota bacterium]
MEVIIKKDRSQASLLGAKIIADVIKKKPAAVIGLATGSTPLGLYDELVKMHKAGELSFSRVTSFNLDEYVGLGPEHKCSFYSEMHQNLFSRVDIAPEAVNIPDGLARNIPAMCAAYEDKIKNEGGIDIQLLGIGNDGHLAFNEPGSSLSSRTRLKTLSHETIEANARFFGSQDAVPRHVVTMGLGTIMEARVCLLLAFGADKAEAVYQMVEGPVSATWPGTVLQHHPRTIVILDEASAGRLKRRDYYLEVYAGKPDWQCWE